MNLKSVLRRIRCLLRDTLLQEQLNSTRRLLEIEGTRLQDGFLLDAPKYKDQRCLARCLGRVYSQCNEDAVISEIFRRISIQSRFFVEVGVSDGIENVTRLLLETGWSGVWVEANSKSVAALRKLFAPAIESKQLTVIEAMVTRENISSLLTSHSVPAEFDLLSIDIDMNTSHVWRALDGFRPRVVCIEYNASYPPSVAFEVPYNATAVWDQSNRFGASLKTLELIGRDKGYVLVGCDFTGVNAYFVIDEFADERFCGPFTSEAAFEPARYALASVQRGHPARGRRE